MIKIHIETDGKEIYDSLDNIKCNMEEVGVVLLRLKQIEQELINMKFESKFEIEEKY